MADDALEMFFADKGWEVAYSDTTQQKTPEFLPTNDLNLTAEGKKVLSAFGGGIYVHQHRAIAAYIGGNNIGITTSTASGKTLIFNVCAVEELAKDPNSRVAAIYPLKALAGEQSDRWAKALTASGSSATVGRIDGGVPQNQRQKILQTSRVVVLTPDIIHAWLLGTIDSPAVIEFLRNLRLVVIDEAHTYSGVFGSNAAFLFRRMLHATRKLGGDFRIIASSATMSAAENHLLQLTGVPFTLVGQEHDTSPRAPMKLLMVSPPKNKDVLGAVAELVVFAAQQTEHQSVTFLDSRKQTEYLASIVERGITDQSDSTDSNEPNQGFDFHRLRELKVYPYRSGYEEDDRILIQKRLATGSLRGVISTSALEMGIDLPHLTLGILMGIPRSATSYYQRIGRVGRRLGGTIVVVNNGSVLSEAVFRDPQTIKTLPLAASALYLHNQRIQYIHAMCLAQPGGEDDAVSTKSQDDQAYMFTSPQDMPDDFLRLCNLEKVGEISAELQSMKAQAGDDPHHTFPLRDLDSQFKVQWQQGPNQISLGSLSFAQLLREAYPGAVYYYQAKAYRVVRIKKQQRIVEVRPEKKYFTSPNMLPTVVLPNLTGDNQYGAMRYGELLVIECAMQVGEAVVGFKERRGNNEFRVDYPLNSTLGLYWDSARFPRYAFTSGVVMTHPALGWDEVKCAQVAEIFAEAFLMSLPFDRQDISAGADKHRATRDGVTAGDRFVCVYDQTYGSLRLTSHLMNTDVLRSVFQRVVDIAQNDANLKLSGQTLQAVEEMANSVLGEPEHLVVDETQGSVTGKYVPVIMPESMGIDIKKDNEEFHVQAVIYSPQFNAVAYRGYHSSNQKKLQAENKYHTSTTVIVRAEHIVPLSGESRTGYYNEETGELVNQLPLPGEF